MLDSQSFFMLMRESCAVQWGRDVVVKDINHMVGGLCVSLVLFKQPPRLLYRALPRGTAL